ncbi:MAG: hypothetical protein A3E87_10715 [Gammaproteobacteria bacterium RIFCSPHIGHO2_12_FULL_35_23]|nr:MAG: hypothetical protein A3E87_10715 [Gammaproteobacteria bacterium RIFCSPHIGHO2_12_FULL_35_23]
MKTKNQEAIKRLFTEQEAAEYLGVSRSYLRQDRMQELINNRTPGPHYCRFGKMIRYTKEALDAWIERHIILRAKNE